MGVKLSLKTIIKRTPLYTAYRYCVDQCEWRRMKREFWEWSGEDQKRLGFYRQFVSMGDLVFDVGANLGNRAKVFSKLGAVVVAVEPQTMCADFLQFVFRKTDKFYLVREALGASTGQTEMLVSNAHTISSLSPDWISAVTESGRFSNYKWNRKETVSINTLDNLIAKYGSPAFAKIDVEGYEDQVVLGLSTPIRALSMEFTPEFMGIIHKCIEHLSRIGCYQFQISLGESMEFALPDWVTAGQIRRELHDIPSDAFGDLYACVSAKEGAAPDSNSTRLHTQW